MIKINVSRTCAETTQRERLTSGMQGVELSFSFSADWDDLVKTAVFEGSGRRIALTNIGDSCIIPHEVLAKHGGALRVGVYGRTADGSAATPTVYAQLGIIQRGADPNADPSTKPTLPVWAQIQAQIGDLSALTTEDKTNLVAAINEAAKSGGGSGGGKDGTGIESITYKGEDEDGGNVYTVLLTDGSSYDITAPKGAKGDKGDTGATGPQGPAGAPGKDGASMGITGATVGQIAKIAAVDASGAPTAWEPVDMPTGGGETPSTYTVTQTLENVSSSNGGTSVQAGTAYTTTLTAADGYTLDTVTVTMGGVDITSTAWDADTGAVSINAVTGDIVITASASAATLDTSPAIAKTGYSLNSNGGEYEYATDGACYTELYTLKTGAKTLTLYIADSVDVAFSAGGKMQFWDAAQQVEYWSPMNYRNSERAFNIKDGATRFRTSLALADVESSYAYDDTGHVYFAGKNTRYYGKENIYGTASNTAAKSESVDNAYMALSMSTGVTANTTAYTGLTSDYVSMVQANYDAFIADVMGDYNRIPFIVHTDQHGRIGAKNPVLKLIGDITNWYEISRCINLGDTVADRFSATTLQAYLDAAKDCIPLSRRLDVYGNHDIWDADEDQKYTVDQKRLSPYFKNIYARRHGNNGYFTVADDYYNVKYLVINNMEYPATNYSTRRITTGQANFIVEELSKKDGYDIILLSHVPLVTDDTMTSRDSSYQAYTETFLSDATANTSFLAMIAARKAKTSGTFTDSEGVEHAYDFSGCDSELLMSLHGHTHFEAYKALPGSITEFAFDWFDGNTFYFAYIDRNAKKFKRWKNEIDVAALEIDI